MSGIATLQRVYSWQLEQARRRLGGLHGRLAALAADRDRLAEAVRAEGALAASPEAAGSIEAARGFSGFLAAALARRREIDARIAALELEICGAESAVAEALRDQKACEAALERIESRRRTAERRRRQSAEDDAGRRLVLHGPLPGMD